MKPVTMAEIDAARARADAAIAARRAFRAEPRPRLAPHRGYTLRRLAEIERVVTDREFTVLALLRRWWAQGCREGGPT